MKAIHKLVDEYKGNGSKNGVMLRKRGTPPKHVEPVILTHRDDMLGRELQALQTDWQKKEEMQYWG